MFYLTSFLKVNVASPLEQSQILPSYTGVSTHLVPADDFYSGWCQNSSWGRCYQVQAVVLISLAQGRIDLTLRSQGWKLAG